MCSYESGRKVYAPGRRDARSEPYDAWNRLATVERAYRNSGGTLTAGSVVASYTYDGLGRRVVKTVGDGNAGSHEIGDLEGVQHEYYNGQRMVELRNGSSQVLKQHVWGLGYVDELCQIAINQDPADTNEDTCERTFWAMQDGNYNVLGVVNATGVLTERYEYTPYGQRAVFAHGWSPCDFDGDGDVDSADSTALASAVSGGSEPADSIYDLDGDGGVDSDDQTAYTAMAADWNSKSADSLVMYRVLESFRTPIYGSDAGVGLCDVGHQGLLHDRETGLVYNRARYLSPRLGRFLSRDPLDYVDGMSLYQYVRSGPIGALDPSGLESAEDAMIKKWKSQLRAIGDQYIACLNEQRKLNKERIGWEVKKERAGRELDFAERKLENYMVWSNKDDVLTGFNEILGRSQLRENVRFAEFELGIEWGWLASGLISPPRSLLESAITGGGSLKSAISIVKKDVAIQIDKQLLNDLTGGAAVRERRQKYAKETLNLTLGVVKWEMQKERAAKKLKDNKVLANENDKKMRELSRKYLILLQLGHAPKSIKAKTIPYGEVPHECSISEFKSKGWLPKDYSLSSD